MPAQALSSTIREDGTVVVTVGRQDLAQANLVLTPEGRGDAQIQQVMDTLYRPEELGAITVSRKQEQKRG